MMQNKNKQDTKKTAAVEAAESEDYYCENSYYASTSPSKKMIVPIEIKSIIICSNCQNNNNNNNNNCVDCNLLQLDQDEKYDTITTKTTSTTTCTTTEEKEFKFKFNSKDKKDKKMKKRVAFIEDVETSMPMPAWPSVPAWPLSEGSAKLQQLHQHQHVAHQHVVVGVVGGVCY